MLCEVGIDPPIAHRVGIGQGVASDGAAETQMIELGRLRAQTSFDVAQAFAPGQLRERQTQILIKAGEPLDLVLATIARDAPTKCRQRQMRHDLGKYVMALLHRGQILRWDIASCARIRSPTEIETASKSLFYIVLQNVSLLPTCNVGTVVIAQLKTERNRNLSEPLFW